ncbi:PREDICTED: uncharacterized protein LOC108765505 isoform X2 [Trachymyrmex cornetzi]|nr:PREDICTED: uncharacterized protein LOC108765505 isoform X2 [Trachymyrmex cornetzi]
MKIPSKNGDTTSQHERNTNQKLNNLTLIDETTNKKYVIKVPMEVYNRAHNDLIFATMLLQNAKLLLNSKGTHNPIPPTNMMANDISKPSCSNVTRKIVSNDTVENILHDNIISDTEDISVNKWLSSGKYSGVQYC